MEKFSERAEKICNIVLREIGKAIKREKEFEKIIESGSTKDLEEIFRKLWEKNKLFRNVKSVKRITDEINRAEKEYSKLYKRFMDLLNRREKIIEKEKESFEDFLKALIAIEALVFRARKLGINVDLKNTGLKEISSEDFEYLKKNAKEITKNMKDFILDIDMSKRNGSVDFIVSLSAGGEILDKLSELFERIFGRLGKLEKGIYVVEFSIDIDRIKGIADTLRENISRRLEESEEDLKFAGELVGVKVEKVSEVYSRIFERLKENLDVVRRTIEKLKKEEREEAKFEREIVDLLRNLGNLADEINDLVDILEIVVDLQTLLGMLFFLETVQVIAKIGVEIEEPGKLVETIRNIQKEVLEEVMQTRFQIIEKKKGILESEERSMFGRILRARRILGERVMEEVKDALEVLERTLGKKSAEV